MRGQPRCRFLCRLKRAPLVSGTAVLAVCVYVYSVNFYTANVSETSATSLLREGASIRSLDNDFLALQDRDSRNAEPERVLKGNDSRGVKPDRKLKGGDFDSLESMNSGRDVVKSKTATDKADFEVSVVSNETIALLEGGSQHLDFLNTSTVLLGGVLRKRNVFLAIGVVTVSREKGSYFFNTLASLLTKMDDKDHDDVTIVVMLADRSAVYNAKVLTHIKELYERQLQNGELLIIRKPNTDAIFNDGSIKRTYNDSLQRVRWRSKQNLDYAALMEFSSQLSTYYLQLEDDVIAVKSYVRHIRGFISANARTVWAMLEFSPSGFIGKLFKSVDLPKLVTILRTFYLEQPCDFLIKPYFINIMLQKKPIVRKARLFFHEGRYSSLKNVTRKVDKLTGGAGKKAPPNVVVKKPVSHQNPKAELATNMSKYGSNDLENAYDPGSKNFFWASDVTVNQYVSVMFEAPQVLRRIVVETGFSIKDERDSLRSGVLKAGVSTSRPEDSDTSQCGDLMTLGKFQKGRLDIKVPSDRKFLCLTIAVTESQKEWLVIRGIYIFPSD